MTLAEYVEAIRRSDQPIRDALYLGFVQQHKLRAIRRAAFRSQDSPLRKVCLELTEDNDGAAL